jgi:dipeptidyl aminopeptidase/acylaminoacyl peptidase
MKLTSSKILIPLFIAPFVILVIWIFRQHTQNPPSPISDVQSSLSQTELRGNPNPLSIQAMRSQKYPGSQLTIEQTLSPGSNYHRYLASYQSDGLKIYGLLTVPTDNQPQSGWPAIIFNHGYIPPEQYRTTQRYVAYVDAFAKNGYLVFKPDYRGHGSSEGQPQGAYYSPAYATDVLNALATVKNYPDADPQSIGIWGHSMGGNLALRALVISPDIQAAVIWSGVVGTYQQLMTQWHRTRPWHPSDREIASHVGSIRQNLVENYGTPTDNPEFWQSIDPRFFLSDISAPVQLHQGLADEEVPPLFSQSLYQDLTALGKPVEYYTYPGADHNLSSPAFQLAMQRSLNFFNQYLKGGENFSEIN